MTMTYEQQEKGRADRAEQWARGATASALVSLIAHPTSGSEGAHHYRAACEELDRRIPPRGSE